MKNSNRAELIEEIKDYIGSNPHESVVDYMNESDDKELEFFIWRVQNDWIWYDSNERFLNLATRRLFTREQLLELYTQSKN